MNDEQLDEIASPIEIHDRLLKAAILFKHAHDTDYTRHSGKVVHDHVAAKCNLWRELCVAVDAYEKEFGR